jgi:predicted anti-sigma-YlaC factor YlaD
MGRKAKAARATGKAGVKKLRRWANKQITAHLCQCEECRAAWAVLASMAKTD